MKNVPTLTAPLTDAQSKSVNEADSSVIMESPAADKKVLADVDEAFNYLNDHTATDTESVHLKALRRKIDWHIVPIMFACYTLQFLDKVAINVSFCSPFLRNMVLAFLIVL